ncbi:hypothetical protein ACFFJT_06755 [Dyella flava]|uniref:Uncharacterized protein n=1 Tax=Dyella flava TaxID=1920170 RepID=A0ABS2JYR0_9GAMM|nr:hypothetical protein [Dyella flava]MBM7124146.1 hypothetical protein [Dyella flava]
MSNEEIVRSIPNAISGESSNHEATSTNRSELSRRFIATIGENNPPTSNAYCENPIRDPSDDRSISSPELILTICDGGRLVAWSRTRMDPHTTSPADVAYKVKRLKNLVLIGIAYSPSQYTPIEVASSFPSGD